MRKIIFLFSILPFLLNAQQITIGDNKGEITFEEYNPKSTLVVEEHIPTKAKYPFVDIHNHQWGMADGKTFFDDRIKDMDSLNMAIMVNLSGRGWRMTPEESSAYLENSIKEVKKYAPGRFVVFTNIDFDNISDPNWTEKAVKILEDDVKLRGAQGLKIYKSLGFNVKNADNTLVAVDDPRIDPIWEKCGELGIPILIHSADPAPFWQPVNAQNERWLELKTHPGRKRDVATGDFSWEQIMEQQHNVFRKHPKTNFINAHMGWYPNDLAKLDSLLTAMPNMYVEIGAVIAELGRQPRTANKFFTKWQDKILFGKDSWKPEEYVTYFRVLETDDEYFQYHKKYHAFWPMYGIGLSDDVLKKVYYKNAIKLVPGIDTSFFPKE